LFSWITRGSAASPPWSDAIRPRVRAYVGLQTPDTDPAGAIAAGIRALRIRR
jgi:hypothetical protein